MNTAVKKKLCWNCEGNVSRDAMNCPYCGVYLHREEDRDEDLEDLEEASHSPPYQPPLNTQKQDSIPTPPYASASIPQAMPKEEVKIAEKQEPWFKTSTDWPKVMIPLVLLMAGSVFLLFALLIALFSQNGFLTLSWSFNTWFIFAFAAVPMLYLGWRSLRQLKE